jgi:hypothetical protein
VNVLDCPHCRELRRYVAASSERLGRPVDSYDAESYAIPFAALPKIADVQDCACTCHAHLTIVGRWAPPS